MVPEVEVEVWVTIQVRGKNVGFSSLGRFQDSTGLRKAVAPPEDGDGYCSVGMGNKKFQFPRLDVHQLFTGRNLLPTLRRTTATTTRVTIDPTI